MVYKVPKRRRRYFKKRVLHWMTRFSLNNWEPRFNTTKSDEHFADVTGDSIGRICIFTLSTRWHDLIPTKREIDRTAFHEVCELLLWDLEDLGNTRSATSDQIRKSAHSVVRRLENVILDPHPTSKPTRRKES